ncbi:MAG: hypothetical protein DRH12_05975 [Deltaproteobacteria bacterium]|nr:MAG: hypothetical protein DRH12_05975 [Deltaproteobacteria bacterium]RLB78508.1 MAG: hypothetical protein DRH15_10045 [Deltaproteobacteria bacterium]
MSEYYNYFKDYLAQRYRGIWFRFLFGLGPYYIAAPCQFTGSHIKLGKSRLSIALGGRDPRGCKGIGEEQLMGKLGVNTWGM